MIRSFADRETERLWNSGRSRRFTNIARVALRKPDMIDAAVSIGDLRAPPGNRLEALKGNRSGQHSIRVNDQWRICFVWTDDGVENVEIVDYH